VVKPAPQGYEAKLRSSELGDPVLVVPKDFEAALQRAEAPVLALVSDSANKRSEAGSGRLQRLVAGFNRERATLGLALRGVSGELLETVRLNERDLANPQTRGTQITGMLPFFVLMAVLYGALNAALDTTAGERERGSLEPLLMNPAAPLSLVLGKWAAVSAVALLIAVLSCFSFIPAQWLLRSDTLAALFQFGWREALWFVAIIAPFAAALSALLMAVLYGALNAALDTTAGERERGSLEPLLMNPAAPLSLVLGKWAAVSAVALLIAVLSCFSFIPAQWLLRSDTLAALFQFGWREALWFVAIIAPFAAALSALLMAIAIRCRSVKEAQASSAVLILAVSLLPLVGLLNPGGEERWHLWVPALAQNTLMTRVLRGESLGAEAVLVPLALCAVLTLVGTGFVAKVLRRAAVR
jgi:ABC-type Na+ efflux pump permease subunit